MADEPTVSVLMGVYNEEDFLSESIDSILAQTVRDFEFLIVDDNSDDRSPEIIDSYDDDRIQVIQNETNQGLTVSLNRALKHAQGRYIARQDADDISEPERLERQIQFLETHEQVAVVGTGALLIDDENKVVDRRVGYCNPDFEDFIDKGHLIHGSIMARGSILEAVGGYDEFFRYAQDQDLWLRIAKDHPIANIPSSLYRHRIHDNSVYFSRKDESTMYGMLARDFINGKSDAEMKSYLESEGVLAYYDELSPERRSAFHRSLARRYLRSGHTAAALEECRQARQYEPYDRSTLLMSGLAYTGPVATMAVRWGMRRYLNLKTRLSNQMHCPYQSD